MLNKEPLEKICRVLRYDILTSTTAAGSGHLTSSLSAVELMATLFFGGFLHYDLKNPKNLGNDKVIFSKGHAAPLLYSLYHAAGVVSLDELLTLRTFNSNLEGHPTPRFPYVDVATGSLGQGLSVGVGMALAIKLNFEARNPRSETNNDSGVSVESTLPQNDVILASDEGARPESISNFDIRISDLKQKLPKVFVLLGDSEVAEGQIWEALEIASYYRLDNLIGILDVNRLGQRGETMFGWDLKTYEKRISSFGWETILIDDGHDLEKVSQAFKIVENSLNQLKSVENSKPKMIIAKTVKGKGVSFLEDKEGWHGKALTKEQLEIALKELGEVDLNMRAIISKPLKFEIRNPSTPLRTSPKSVHGESVQDESETNPNSQNSNNKLLHVTSYMLNDLVSTREAYGDALVEIGKINPDVLVLDAETSNSTFTEKFKKVFPERFFEMFIAEQNMISTALGLSKLGFTPYVSTFSAFLSRAFDQLRIAQYSEGDLKIVCSHAGVFVGPDGPSQEGLEDISLMRSILNSVVLHPSDAIACYKLTREIVDKKGIIYLRTLRDKVPVIYNTDEEFEIGGSKILKQSQDDKAIVIAAGVTVHEALKACDMLSKENIKICVVDAYSIKPIDEKTILSVAEKVKNIIVVEDHYPYGGLGEAVASVILGRSDGHRTNSRIDSGQVFRQVFDREAQTESAQDTEQSRSARMTEKINLIHLCVRKIPRSGKSEELLSYEEIDAQAIVKKVKEML